MVRMRLADWVRTISVRQSVTSLQATVKLHKPPSVIFGFLLSIKRLASATIQIVITNVTLGVVGVAGVLVTYAPNSWSLRWGQRCQIS